MNDYEDMPQNQYVFDDLLDKYNAGNEPLSGWLTEDLLKLMDAADRELQQRNTLADEYKTYD